MEFLFLILFVINRKVDPQQNHEGEFPKKRNLATKAIADLFKAKIDLLQNELQIIRIEYKKKVSKIFYEFENN